MEPLPCLGHGCPVRQLETHPPASNWRTSSRPAKDPPSFGKCYLLKRDGGLDAERSTPWLPFPPQATPYDQWSPDTRALDLVGDKWTLLIVRDLAAGPRRFVELQRVLPGISTEQLRSRLNRMVADGLLTRQRYREVPPRVDYELTERASELMPVLGALARWGYDWAWSAPRAGEDIDIGAIVRLAPGLLAPPQVAARLGGARRHRQARRTARPTC